ncbi:hypothetical protein ACFQAT_13815 [Undibacterium arcticum]|uniref:Uncharacterized protein n=1 Tax=Undibacterium arcticum TaxID=1762892 RepID=A0ABV7EX56_9BURK
MRQIESVHPAGVLKIRQSDIDADGGKMHYLRAGIALATQSRKSYGPVGSVFYVDTAMAGKVKGPAKVVQEAFDRLDGVDDALNHAIQKMHIISTNTSNPPAETHLYNKETS